MHLAMVVDESRLATDGPAIQRTAVAMASAGARIHRVIPTFREEPPLARLLPASGFEFGSSRLFWPSRLGALSSALEEDRPDAFIAFGARAFAAAAQLAEDLDAALVAMPATSRELEAMPLRAHRHRLDLLCVPTAPLAVRAGQIVDESLVTVLPLGVAIPSRPDAAAPASLAIAGSGRDEGAYRALFGGLSSVAPHVPELQVAIELPPGHDPHLWTLARELGVQRLLNGVSSLESIRPLALACGTLALPEAVGGTRTLVLEAMALGRTVVTMDDPMADHLIDGVTALVAAERESRIWGALLAEALRDGEVARRVRAEGAVRSAARFGSAICARHLADACSMAVTGGAIPFPGPDADS